MYAYKKGNILIGAMIFLFMATIFSGGIYRAIKSNLNGMGKFKVDKSVRELSSDITKVIKECEELLNNLEEIELEEVYKVGRNSIKLKSNGDAELIFDGDRVEIEFSWEFISICSCKIEDCVFKGERTIIKPKREGG